ncbi:MAG: ATP-binding cassette domain-containing protein [Deltaproteobacteria bacterium]|nr:ATP-binding cassette domain-containing protein [Deltaproteobacteria bacterium]
MTEPDQTESPDDEAKAAAQPGPTLRLEQATRRFGPLVAVRELNLTLRPGRLHALIGENGAGKSTALNLLAGHLEPSEGRVVVGGEPLIPATPQEAMGRSVGMVHQHFMLVEAFTAVENLVLGGASEGALGKLDLAKAAARAHRIGRQARLDLDLDQVTEQLSVGERQRLEILRVLFRGARAILLDEPTAVLSPVEVDELYQTLRSLAKQGATIAVVTHRLDEVVRFCDDVTVMRRGVQVLSEPLVTATRDTEEPAEDQPTLTARLTRAIMGGEPPPEAEPPTLSDDAAPTLELRDLRALRPNGSTALDGLSLTLAAGEVVGIAGVEGNGQRELARALAGLLPLADGSVRLEGELLHQPAGAGGGGRAGDRSAAVRHSRSRGLVVVHEDRHRDELLLGASVADNLLLGDLGTRPEQETVTSRFARFDVHPPDPGRDAGELSGGNQQKVVMARAIDRTIRALVLAQPTRGVDIGAARAIHHAVAEVAAAGAAVLLISADLHELRSLSHRLVVIRKGTIVAELSTSASDETIGRAMLGMEAA